YDKQATLATLAAAYGHGITTNHPFIDGNKRTAVLTMEMFLGLNGYYLPAPRDSLVETVRALSDGKLSEQELAEWVAENMLPE
ncbi:MAG: type II toxin-antitoxin system death-on-curing family toxin, partial [Gemmatimonadales bacterium]